MNRFLALVFVCALLVSGRATRALGQAAPAAAPTFDYQAKFLGDMKDLQTKFVGLAQAIPQDKYTWRPGDGVRSVSEVFLHVAGGNYNLTSLMGAPPNPGYNRQGFETSTTDKAAIVDQLNKSFAYMDSYIQSLSAADLQKSHQMFGHPASGYDTMFTIVLDLHEHLGQMIAYARQNNVVPPWTAERQAARPVGDTLERPQPGRGRGTPPAPPSGLGTKQPSN